MARVRRLVGVQLRCCTAGESSSVGGSQWGCEEPWQMMGGQMGPYGAMQMGGRGAGRMQQGGRQGPGGNMRGPGGKGGAGQML